jgi:hypothetical protein
VIVGYRLTDGRDVCTDCLYLIAEDEDDARALYEDEVAEDDTCDRCKDYLRE